MKEKNVVPSVANQILLSEIPSLNASYPDWKHEDNAAIGHNTCNKGKKPFGKGK